MNHPKGLNPYKIIDEETVILYLYHRNGDVLECKIDSEDLELLKKFNHRFSPKYDSRPQTFYASCRIIKSDGKIGTKLLHNIILNTNNIIHHKDHNGLNNKKYNLEIISNQLNSTDRRGKNKNNKSGYRNVCWIENYGKWCVQLQVNGKNTMLGKFDDVEEAGQFAEKMREKYYKNYKGKG